MPSSWFAFVIFVLNVFSDGMLNEIINKIPYTSQITMDLHRQLNPLRNYDSSEMSISKRNSTTELEMEYIQTIQILICREDCDSDNLKWEVDQLNYILKNSVSSFIVEEVYRVRNKLIRNSVNLSSFKDDFQYKLAFPLKRRVNFHEAIIPVVTYKTERVIGQIDPLTGLITGNRAAESILRDIQFLSNFKITLRVFTDKEIPVTTSNYFAAGVLQQFDNNSADLAIGYFNIRTDRISLASPLLPIMAEGIYGFFSQPDITVVRNIYLEPVQPTGICIYLLIIFGIGFYCYIAVITTYKKDCGFHDRQMSQIIILVAALVSLRSPGTLLMRNMVFLMGSFISVVVYAIYCGKLLTALLTTVQPVKTIEDLMLHGFTFHSMPAAREVVFNDTKRHLTRREKNFEETSIQAIFEERHVLIDVDFNTINGFSWFIRDILNPPLSDREICSKLSSIQFLNSNAYLSSTFFVKKKSPLRGIFNNHLLKIRQVGLLIKYVKYTNTESASLSCGNMWSSLGYQDDLRMADVFSAFLLLGTTMLVSILVCIFEWSLFRIFKFLKY